MVEDRPPLRLDEYVKVPIMVLGMLLVLCTILVTDRINAYLATDELKVQRQIVLDVVRENRDRYAELIKAYVDLNKSVNVLGDVIRSYERTLVEQKILEEERRRSIP
jgi:hypothetical protein